MAEFFEPVSTNLDDAGSSKARSPFMEFLRHFLHNRAAVVGSLIVALLAAFACYGVYMTAKKDSVPAQVFEMVGLEKKRPAPILDPNATYLKSQLLSPFTEGEYEVRHYDDEGNIVPEKTEIKTKMYWLGSDQLGRDVFLRLMAGASISLMVGVLVILISVTIGILVGGIAGFYGKGHVQIPFVICVVGPPLAAVVATIEHFGVMASVLSWSILGFTLAMFVLSGYAAFFSEKRSAIFIFLLVLAQAGFVFGYPAYRETVGETGSAITSAKERLAGVDDLLSATKDYTQAIKDAEEQHAGDEAAIVEELKDDHLDYMIATAEYNVIKREALLADAMNKARISYEGNPTVKWFNFDDDLKNRRAERPAEKKADDAKAAAATKARKAAALKAAREAREKKRIERANRKAGIKPEQPKEEEKPEDKKEEKKDDKAKKPAAKKKDPREEAQKKILNAIILQEDLLEAAKANLESLLEKEPDFVDDVRLDSQLMAPGVKATEKKLAANVDVIGTAKDNKILRPRQIRLRKSIIRKEPALSNITIKEGYAKIGKEDAIFSWLREVPILIASGFIFILGFLLFAYAGQCGAREMPRFRGWFKNTMTVDNFVMRVIEILGSVPRLFLLLTILAFYEKNVWLVMFVLGVTSWMGTARFVRAEILSLRERDFIQASRALGLSDAGIIIKHLVPNALSPVLVSASIGVATAIIAESTLSFLGFGAGPEQVTWGKMLAEGREFITSHAHLTAIPGIAIFIVVLAFNLLGEGLREATNPKLRKR